MTFCWRGTRGSGAAGELGEWRWPATRNRRDRKAVFLVSDDAERYRSCRIRLLPTSGVISCSSAVSSNARDEFRRAATMTCHERERALLVGPGGDTWQSEPMLNQVADGVWVRQSEWVLSNAIAVRGEDGLILFEPACR
jgi:hypothetical protein